jgi:hypothetical protein
MVKILIWLSIFIVGIGEVFGQSPIDKYGKLKLVGLQLSSECGNPVQLRGISTHGPQWFNNCYNVASVAAAANDWGADVFRLALYVEEGGYVNNPTYWKNWIDTQVDEVGKNGMYCLIDWHVLADGDPMKNIDAAKDFWDYMSKKHGKKKHVIFEICNEPNERYLYGTSANEKTINWLRIKEYAEIIIPIIRANDPETIIIVGTPFWSNRPWRVVGNPLTGDNAYNTMYAYHFYAGTPQHILNADTVRSVLNTIPIFATEWGLSEESGTGIVDTIVAQNFADMMAGNNPAGIKVSWCVWSYADKDETSALLTPYSCTNGTWSSRTTAGKKTYKMINESGGTSLSCYPEPAISRQPQNVVVKAGATGTMSVAVAGENVTVQWQKSTDGGTTWTNISNTGSTLTITAAKTNDEGYYRVKVSNYIGYLYSQKAFFHILTAGPYNGTPFVIPGKIEAELYDEGGNNESYFDNSNGNNGNSFRTDDVDIQSTTDSLGGYSVGWWETTEWLDFTVNILASTNYDFSFRIGSALTGTKFKVQIDGKDIIATVDVPNLNSWSLFRTVTVKGVALTAGLKKLRIVALTDGFNFNYLEIKGPIIDCNNTINGTATVDSCGFCSGGTTGRTAVLNKTKCLVITDLTDIQAKTPELALVPNPAQNSLQISGLDNGTAYTLYNVSGNEVSTGIYQGKISLEGLADGLYFVKLDHNKVLKLVIGK